MAEGGRLVGARALGWLGAQRASPFAKVLQPNPGRADAKRQDLIVERLVAVAQLASCESAGRRAWRNG